MANESWQSAWVEVLPDFSKFTRKANKEMSGVLGAAGTAGGVVAGKNIGGGVLGGIRGLGGAVIGAVAALGIGRLVGNAIGSGIRYGLDAVNLASELEQSTGAVRSVFKDQSTIIEGFAQGAAKSVGLAKTQYQSFATVVGAQLKNLGIPMSNVAGQTDSLIKLGADLAAQFGGSTSDAVSALSSLLRGERDPIERYGVGIKQADINARLAAEGLGKLEGEQRKQAEIQATLAILWEQTADAQGTFAAEGETLAGQQQRLQATLADTQTKLGESLLPAFSALAGFANETLAPALDRMIDKVGPVLGQALTDAAPKVEQLADKMTPLVEAFVASAAEDGIPAFIDTMDDIAEAAPEWVKAFESVDQAVRDFDQAYRDSQEWLKSNVADPLHEFLFGKARDDRIKWAEDVFGIGSPMAQKIKDGMSQTGAAAGDNLSLGVQSKRPVVEAGFLGVTSPMAQKVRAQLDADMFAAGKSAGDGLIGGIKFKTPEAAAAAAGMGRRAVEAFRQEMKIQSPSKVMAELGAYMGEGLVGGLNGSQSKVDSAMRSLVSVPSVTPGVRATVGVGAARDGRLAEVVNFYETVSADATAMTVARRQNALGAV